MSDLPVCEVGKTVGGISVSFVPVCGRQSGQAQSSVTAGAGEVPRSPYVTTGRYLPVVECPIVTKLPCVALQKANNVTFGHLPSPIPVTYRRNHPPNRTFGALSRSGLVVLPTGRTRWPTTHPTHHPSPKSHPGSSVLPRGCLDLDLALDLT